MIATTEHVDWVQRRFDCSSESIALELKKQVKADVDRVNRRRSRGIPFTTFGDDLTHYEVAVDRHPELGFVKFERKPDRIIIRRNSAPERIVTWSWVKDSATCQLRLDDEPSELWKISQAALYDLFFPQG